MKLTENLGSADAKGGKGFGKRYGGKHLNIL